MSIICIIVLFFLCMVLFKPGFKFFLLWLAICGAVFCFLNMSAGVWGMFIYCFIWGSDSDTESSSSSNHSNEVNNNSNNHLYDKLYRDGSHRVENLSKTGYYYSNGDESRLGMFGEEHRSNGDVVRENAYISGRRDIYNDSGEYIGYEYEDALGITHRIHK